MTTQLRPSRSLGGRMAVGLSLVLAIALTTMGCAKPTTAKVFGKVLQADGKPLPGGSVVFYPTEGKTRHASAEIQTDGSYDMPAAPVGKVKITVNNIHLKEGVPPPVGMGGGMPMPAPGKGGKGGGPQASMMKGKGAPPKGVDAGPPKSNPDKSKAPEAKTTAPVLDRYVPINEKFGDPEKSGLTFEVKPGSQQHDITLK